MFYNQVLNVQMGRKYKHKTIEAQLMDNGDQSSTSTQSYSFVVTKI